MYNQTETQKTHQQKRTHIEGSILCTARQLAAAQDAPMRKRDLLMYVLLKKLLVQLLLHASLAQKGGNLIA
jgi:hypothetical protein